MGLLVLLCWGISVSQTKERLSLQDAITIALEKNPESLASAEQINVERGRFWRGISPPPPSVAVNYQYIPQGSSVAQFGERSVEISQSLDFPTTIYYRGVQLSSAIDLAGDELSAARSAIVSRVKMAYYNVLAKQKKIELNTENLAIAEDFAHEADVRYAVGDATHLERLTAAVQRTQAHNAVAAARNDLKIAYGELFLELGQRRDSQNSEIILTDSLVYRPFTATLEQLTETAFAFNPRLKAAAKKVSIASLGRTLAWSSVLPNLNASLYRQTVDGNSNFYGVSFGVTVPLWFMFDQRGQIQEASSGESIAEHTLRSLTNSIRLNVRNAFLEMENYERQIRLHQAEILPQANEVYRTAHASYAAGEITYVEYLQARQLVISSRNEYIEELARYYSSLAQLEHAVGAPLIY